MTLELPKRKMYRYCLADIAKGLFNGMIGNYLLYFFQPTLASGLPQLLPDNKLFGFITIMALITALGKLVDAVSDPIVASLSDRYESDKGRRLPFMRISAIPYALSVLLIFCAPFDNGSVLNALWVTLFLILYYVSYTLYFIPKNALVPEIITDAKKRVGYYGISTAFFMGSSSFMYTSTLFVDILKNNGFTPLWSWRIVFFVFAMIGCVCLLLSATAFNENDYVANHKRPQESIIRSFKIMFDNPNFVTFTLADLCSGISMAFFQASMLYYITVLLNVIESQSFLVMICAIAVALCLFPIVVKWSKEVGKKRLLLIAEVIFSVVYGFIYVGDNVVVYFPGKELMIGLAMGVAVAFPFAVINILPQSVISDIIQLDSIKSGINREGMFSAVKTFIEKIASALALMCVSSVLAIGALENEVVGLTGVKLTGVIALIFNILSLVFYAKYDEKSVLNCIEHVKE